MSELPVIEHFDAPDGTRLGLHIVGSGPPLVCVPGGPGRASAYLEDLAGLSKSHTLLRFDLRGTGESELPIDRDSLNFYRLAEDLEVLRVARGLESMDMIAHSAGCFVSLIYAATHPGRVSRLVLITPSARGFADIDDDLKAIRASRSGEDWYADAAELEAELALMPPRQRGRPHRGLRVFGYSRWDERAQEHAASTDRQMSLRATAGFIPSEEQEHSPTAYQLLGQVTCPTMIVVGRHDGVTGVKSGHLIAAELADAHVVELDDCGHYPWVDVPDAFRDSVLSFLA